MQKQDTRTPVQPSRVGQTGTSNKVPNDKRNMGSHRPVVSTPAGEMDRLFGMWNSL